MTFPNINGTILSQDLSYLFVYANEVTNSVFGWVMVLGFFFVVFLGSLMFQYRFNPTNPNASTSFLASSFATVGWVVLLEQYSGILNPVHFVLVIGIFILALFWAIFGGGD